MNIVDSFRRLGNKNVSFQSVSTIIKIKKNDTRYCGLRVTSDELPQITIRNADKYYPFSCESELDIGWIAMALRPSNNSTLTIRYSANGEIYFTNTIILKSDFERINLPPVTKSESTITIQYKGEHELNFLVHEILDRQELIDQCKGNGIEIGPSFSPQIFSDEFTKVKYIEPDTVETLMEVVKKEPQYNHLIRLFPFYHRGYADSIPVEDASLDFIFSSHLFEHLANPLGHLAYWASKLKKGGTVHAIVPDIRGCKDYVFRPSEMKEIIEEYKGQSLNPTIKHYQRWAEKRRPPGDDPTKYLNERRSIHMHFYTKTNMSELLTYAVKELGFEEFRIIHTQNHKDFYFSLVK